MAGMINGMALRQSVMANTPHTATASGSMASFSTDMVGKLRHLVVGIEPVQDLHGYDNPWPAGGGKNKVDISFATVSFQSVLYSVDLSAGQYTLSATCTNNTTIGGYLSLRLSGVAKGTITIASGDSGVRKSTTFTLNEDGRYDVVGSGAASGYNFTVANVQLEAGSSETDYSPYENICPISGRTGLTLNHSGADTSNPDTLNISWESEAGTVYGGTLDVVTGVLTVDRAMVDLGTLNWTRVTSTMHAYGRSQINDRLPNSVVLCSALPSIYFNSLSIFGNDAPDYCFGASTQNTYIAVRIDACTTNEEYKSALSGVQLVYKLATPQTYQLTPIMVKSLIGNNHVWADTGDVESLTYWTH